MKIERVQYDGEGQWLDVVFDDAERYRLPALLVRRLCELRREMEVSAAEGGTS